MANIKISELNNAATLDGTEYVAIIQNGQPVKTTTGDIAALGGGGPVEVGPIKAFYEDGIQASRWRSSDDNANLGIVSGTYTASVGEYVEVNATNGLLLGINNLVGSFYAFGIRCEIDPNFTPKNTTNWYQASCILGQELSGQQRDFGIIIDKDGYFALGWGNSNITSSDISALDGEIHALFVIADTESVRLFIDGEEKIVESITMTGDQMWRLGVFYNSSGGDTRVDGKIYRVGYFSSVKVNDNYIVPNW